MPFPTAQTSRDSAAWASESKILLKEKTALRGQMRACRHQQITERKIPRGKDDEQVPGNARHLLFCGPCHSSRASKLSRGGASIPGCSEPGYGHCGPVPGCSEPRYGRSEPIPGCSEPGYGRSEPAPGGCGPLLQRLRSGLRRFGGGFRRFGNGRFGRLGRSATFEALNHLNPSPP